MNLKNKLKKEIFRFFSITSDKLFYTSYFDKFQRYYANYYQNNYKLSKDISVHIHVPRTCGTSLSEILKLPNKKNIKFFKGVHTAVSLISPPSEFNYITFIRDPIERIYSYYLMQKEYKKLAYHYHAKKGLDCLLEKCWLVRNAYCQYFSGYMQQDVNSEIFDLAKKNLENFFFVGEYENFENDIKKLMLVLDIECNNIQHIDNYKRKLKTGPNTDEIRKIKFYNYLDIKLYDNFKNKKNSVSL
jgi:hypothetical protein